MLSVPDFSFSGNYSAQLPAYVADFNSILMFLLLIPVRLQILGDDPFSHPSGSSRCIDALSASPAAQSRLFPGSRMLSVPRRVHSVCDLLWLAAAGAVPTRC